MLLQCHGDNTQVGNAIINFSQNQIIEGDALSHTQGSSEIMINEDGIEGVILGCTEIEMLIKDGDVSIPLYDTTQAHIDSLVHFIVEER